MIKDVVLGLTVSLLTENLPEDERARQFSAIHAISSMHPEKTREILNEKLSDIIINKVVDENWDKVIVYLGSVNAWDNLSDACQLKAVAFIEKLEIFDNKGYYTSPSSKNVDILLKAARISFLKEAVYMRLQLPLEKLLSLKEFCQYKLQDNSINEIIEPILEKAIPQANFNQLISMMSEEDSSLKEKIKPYLLEKIKQTSLKELLDGLLDMSQEDNLPYAVIEQHLRSLLDSVFIEELLEVRNKYVSLLSDINLNLDKVIELLDNSLIKLVEKANFDDLLLMKFQYSKKRYSDILYLYSDKLFEKLIEPLMKENTSTIVSNFLQSYSFENAVFNANLLLEIADNLTPAQWESILKAFCENDQICYSYRCPHIFASLFKKSLELHGCVQTYWLSFREKLNTFNNSDKDINRLKQAIDSYLPAE